MRLAIAASCVVCLRKWKQEKERDGRNGEKGVGGDTDEAGTATMTSRALNVGMAEGNV